MPGMVGEVLDFVTAPELLVITLSTSNRRLPEERHSWIEQWALGYCDPSIIPAGTLKLSAGMQESWQSEFPTLQPCLPSISTVGAFVILDSDLI